MARKRVSVTSESKSGRNQQFKDNYTKRSMSRTEFSRRIERGEYPKYYVRKQNGKKTPVSKPDHTVNNNLG